MTKRVNRPRRQAGRKRKAAPESVPSAKFIENLAADGRSVVGVAAALGTSKDRLRRWLDEDPALLDAFERGRERERYNLHNKLYRAAMRGNIVAAMFLLKARHGYREGDQSGEANRVSITFALPGALTPEQFTIEHASKTEHLPVPAKRLTRS